MKPLSFAALAAVTLAACQSRPAVLPTTVPEPPKVSVTIALIQAAGGCQVLTVPASPQVLRGQEVEWTVTGGCSDIPDTTNIEVRFTATANKDAACLFDNPLDTGGLKGKKFKGKVKAAAGPNPGSNRYCYGIYDGSTLLEDPDLDIRGK